MFLKITAGFLALLLLIVTRTGTAKKPAKVFLWILLMVCLCESIYDLQQIDTKSREHEELSPMESYFRKSKEKKKVSNQGNSIEGNGKNRLLCWIMMNSKTHNTSGVAVKETWGKRCDKLIFMSCLEDKELGAINVNVTEGVDYFWGKHRNALKYCYKNHLNDYDWFLKADSDSYVVVENLKYLTSLYDSKFPMTLGAWFHRDGKQNYMTGAGFVISQAALKRVVEISFSNASLCRSSDIGYEDDMEMGRCMKNAGVMFVDSRDETAKHRFFHHKPEKYITGEFQHWWPGIVRYFEEKGQDAFSTTTIIYHNLKDYASLYVFEFLLYRQQIFGLNRDFQGPSVPPLPPDVDTIPDKVKERYGLPKQNQ